MFVLTHLPVLCTFLRVPVLALALILVEGVLVAAAIVATVLLHAPDLVLADDVAGFVVRHVVACAAHVLTILIATHPAANTFSQTGHIATQKQNMHRLPGMRKSVSEKIIAAAFVTGHRLQLPNGFLHSNQNKTLFIPPPCKRTLMQAGTGHEIAWHTATKIPDKSASI